MTADEFIKGAREAIKHANAPIIHLHDAEGNQFATILTPVALGQLEVRGPVTDEVAVEFWMQHDHIEPGMW